MTLLSRVLFIPTFGGLNHVHCGFGIRSAAVRPVIWAHLFRDDEVCVISGAVDAQTMKFLIDLPTIIEFFCRFVIPLTDTGLLLVRKLMVNSFRMSVYDVRAASLLYAPEYPDAFIIVSGGIHLSAKLHWFSGIQLGY